MSSNTDNPGKLAGLFYKYVYNPAYKARSIVSDFFLKNIRNVRLTNKGEIVDYTEGSQIDAAFIAISTVSREVSSTPIDIKQNSDRGPQKLNNHPVYRLLAVRPNKNMSAINFWYSVVWCYLTQGNSYNLIIRDGNFNPVQIIPLLPERVRVEVSGGEKFYVYNGQAIPSRDILHFHQYTIDGVTGISPIEWNQRLFVSKVNQQDYSDNSMGNKPNGFLSGDLSEEQLNQLGKNWTERISKGEMPLLNGSDAKFNSVTIPPNDAQFLETSKYSDQKVYGIYNLPPTFAQDYEDGIKANAEQQALTLIKHTLIAHYMIIEQECNEKLFTERNKKAENPLFVKFNQWGKLRGDTKATNEQIRTVLTLGTWTINEVREKIYDMPKLEGNIGDKVYMQGAMVEITEDGPKKQNGQAERTELEKLLEDFRDGN